MKAPAFLCILTMTLALAACKKDKETGGEAPIEDTEATDTEPAAPEATAAGDMAADETGDDTAAEEEEPITYQATLIARSGSKVGGTVSFTKVDGKVKVEANVTGLKPGEHGFHVHEVGDCSADDAKSAGGHFAPAGNQHGAPDAEKHHAGDFGNITANDEGVAEASWEVDFISLDEGDERSVIGKAVVVHAKADDLKSQPSGDAGARVACGVIGSKG